MHTQTTPQIRALLTQIRDLAALIESLSRCASEDTVEVTLVELMTIASQAHHDIIDHMAETTIDIEHLPVACGGRS
jgi:hypothetical protein